MNSPARYAIAAAAVLVVAIIGYQFLPGRSSIGAPTTAPSPTAIPSPIEAPRLPASGPIDAGTYRMGDGPSILVTVPPGWTSIDGASIKKNVEQPNEVTAFDLYPADILVFADACQSEGAERPVGPTAQDLIAALEAQTSSEFVGPVDATVAGLPGKRFEISAPGYLEISRCSNPFLQIWVDASGTNYLAGFAGGVSAIAYVADTSKGRLLFVPHYGNGTPSDLAERDAIVASIQVTE